MKAVIDIGNTHAKIGLFNNESELMVSVINYDEALSFLTFNSVE